MATTSPLRQWMIEDIRSATSRGRRSYPTFTPSQSSAVISTRPRKGSMIVRMRWLASSSEKEGRCAGHETSDGREADDCPRCSRLRGKGRAVNEARRF
jgi:hypothetical protein